MRARCPNRAAARPPLLQHKAPKLEIKKDPKGVVTVPGATIVDNITTPRELMDTIEAGLARRRVSSTAVRAACGLGWGQRARCRALLTCCSHWLGCMFKSADAPPPPPPLLLQMNRESSRSHLIITICIESTNLQTQNVARGKLSFVDLAGSERCVGRGGNSCRTGAHAARGHSCLVQPACAAARPLACLLTQHHPLLPTCVACSNKKSQAVGEQLKEAQAINKSLSALGNVISALATSQGHVPYRDHKVGGWVGGGRTSAGKRWSFCRLRMLLLLFPGAVPVSCCFLSALRLLTTNRPPLLLQLTMLMSDSIGGSAKTLMFVNVSPVDGNLDETQNSLQVGLGWVVQSMTLGQPGVRPAFPCPPAAACAPCTLLCRPCARRAHPLASPACLPARPQYAQRVSTIRNDVSKHENSAEVMKLKKTIDYWKEQVRWVGAAAAHACSVLSWRSSRDVWQHAPPHSPLNPASARSHLP